MNKILEKPFEYLRRQENGKPFEADVVKNWYIARAYVLELLKDVIRKQIGGMLSLVVLWYGKGGKGFGCRQDMRVLRVFPDFAVSEKYVS